MYGATCLSLGPTGYTHRKFDKNGESRFSKTEDFEGEVEMGEI
jgi:hypothetical protein